MKVQDLYESGNTSITGVMNTIRSIYTNNRPNTGRGLCHAQTAGNIDPLQPDDMIVLYGLDTTVVHSALIRKGQLVDNYASITSSKLMPSGNLEINIRGNLDELEPVFGMSVGDFMEIVNG